MIAGGSDWRSVYLAAFTAYFDASGKQADQPCVAVGGFIATAEQWLDFEVLWLERIKKEGLEYFHVREINHAPEFRNDAERTRRLYVDLIQILKDHVARKIGCCIITKAVTSISPEERRAWNISAYSVAGRSCGAQVRSWCKGWSGALPEFVFEDEDDGSHDLRKIFERDGLPSPHFRPKKDTLDEHGFLRKAAVPLQAADLLAFEWFDPVRKMENDGFLKKIRPSLEELDKIPGSATYINEDQLKSLHEIESMAPDELWLPNGYNPISSIRNPS
jgi:hypothetical protein